jgi:RNA polymerase sigma-70 factor (ECF subfamily)
MGVASLVNTTQIEQAILVERFKKGELGAFDDIMKKYQKQVYNLAYNFIGNGEDAYDISQEVFIKVYKSLDKLRNGSSFVIWLRRITINACTDYLRSKVNEETLDDISYLHNSISSEDKNSDQLMETGELQKIIFRAVERLPKGQRKVFILRHYEGLSLKDIAETLNCSLGTVKAHLFRATRKLRDLLQPYVS